MNCPQCQAANSPESAFCANCGARIAVAETAAPAGYPPPQGYGAPQDNTAPAGHGAAQGYNTAPVGSAPQGSAADGGYDPDATRQRPAYQAGQYPPPAGGPQGYNAPGGYNSGPQQSGFPQGQYQPGSGPQSPRQSSLPPVSFNLSRLERNDKIIAVASFIALISIWLPWYSVSWGASTFESAGSASVSGTTGHGWLWLEFFVALVLLVYLGARAAWDRLPFTLPLEHSLLLVIGTSVQLLLVLIAFLDIPYAGDGVGWDWGAFVGLLAVLVAAAPVVVPAVRSYLARRKATGAGTGTGGPTY